MKKIILLLCFASILQQGFAQFGNLLDRAKNKVNNKVNQKIDQKMDKTIDKGIEGAENSTKNKAKKSGTNSTENKDAESSSDNKRTSSTQAASFKSYSKFDFVPGEKLVASEDFSQDAVGDFPDKWNTNGSGEIVTTSSK
ncbi:MAG: OmpA family protein, partial [Sphingobacteriales bacterium]